MDKMTLALLFARDRIKEPSTHSAISSLSALAGFNVDPGVIQDILSVAAIITGMYGVFLREQPVAVANTQNTNSGVTQ